MEYVSINRNVIASNAKNKTKNPPIRIAKSKSDKKPRYAYEITISGPSRLIYQPDEPVLSCGARLVLETETGNVKIIR